jgi:hypothetical protein
MTERTASLGGGCLCGAIRNQIDATPRFVVQCYCRDCQLATGTGHMTIVGVAAADLKIKGEPRVYSSSGDTGGKVHRHFCGTCGSRLYTSGDLPGAIRMIQAGTLDAPGAVTPTAAIYVKDRVPWDQVDPSLECFPGMIDREPGPARRTSPSS